MFKLVYFTCEGSIHIHNVFKVYGKGQLINATIHKCRWAQHHEINVNIATLTLQLKTENTNIEHLKAQPATC